MGLGPTRLGFRVVDLVHQSTTHKSRLPARTFCGILSPVGLRLGTSWPRPGACVGPKVLRSVSSCGLATVRTRHEGLSQPYYTTWEKRRDPESLARSVGRSGRRWNLQTKVTLTLKVFLRESVLMVLKWTLFELWGREGGGTGCLFRLRLWRTTYIDVCLKKKNLHLLYYRHHLSLPKEQKSKKKTVCYIELRSRIFKVVLQTHRPLSFVSTLAPIGTISRSPVPCIKRVSSPCPRTLPLTITDLYRKDGASISEHTGVIYFTLKGKGLLKKEVCKTYTPNKMRCNSGTILLLTLKVSRLPALKDVVNSERLRVSSVSSCVND